MWMMGRVTGALAKSSKKTIIFFVQQIIMLLAFKAFSVDKFGGVNKTSAVAGVYNIRDFKTNMV